MNAATTMKIPSMRAGRLGISTIVPREQVQARLRIA
jgi:hypothetical protein